MGFYTVGSSVRKIKVIEKIGLTPKIHLQESKIYHQDKMKKGFSRKNNLEGTIWCT